MIFITGNTIIIKLIRKTTSLQGMNIKTNLTSSLASAIKRALYAGLCTGVLLNGSFWPGIEWLSSSIFFFHANIEFWRLEPYLLILFAKGI